MFIFGKSHRQNLNQRNNRIHTTVHPVYVNTLIGVFNLHSTTKLALVRMQYGTPLAYFIVYLITSYYQLFVTMTMLPPTKKQP